MEQPGLSLGVVRGEPLLLLKQPLTSLWMSLFSLLLSLSLGCRDWSRRLVIRELMERQAESIPKDDIPLSMPVTTFCPGTHAPVSCRILESLDFSLPPLLSLSFLLGSVIHSPSPPMTDWCISGQILLGPDHAAADGRKPDHHSRGHHLLQG